MIALGLLRLTYVKPSEAPYSSMPTKAIEFLSVFAMACSAVPLLCAGSLTDCSTALKTATSRLRARLLTG